jgi:hypothetical protein
MVKIKKIQYNYRKGKKSAAAATEHHTHPDDDDAAAVAAAKPRRRAPVWLKALGLFTLSLLEPASVTPNYVMLSLWRSSICLLIKVQPNIVIAAALMLFLDTSLNLRVIIALH